MFFNTLNYQQLNNQYVKNASFADKKVSVYVHSKLLLCNQGVCSLSADTFHTSTDTALTQAYTIQAHVLKFRTTNSSVARL